MLRICPFLPFIACLLACLLARLLDWLIDWLVRLLVIWLIQSYLAILLPRLHEPRRRAKRSGILSIGPALRLEADAAVPTVGRAALACPAATAVEQRGVVPGRYKRFGFGPSRSMNVSRNWPKAQQPMLAHRGGSLGVRKRRKHGLPQRAHKEHQTLQCIRLHAGHVCVGVREWGWTVRAEP